MLCVVLCQRPLAWSVTRSTKWQPRRDPRESRGQPAYILPCFAGTRTREHTAPRGMCRKRDRTSSSGPSSVENGRVEVWKCGSKDGRVFHTPTSPHFLLFLYGLIGTTMNADPHSSASDSPPA